MVVKHPKPLGKETRRTGGRKGPAFAQSGACQAFHKHIACCDPPPIGPTHSATSRQGQSFRGCPRALLLSPHAWLRQVTDSAQHNVEMQGVHTLLFVWFQLWLHSVDNTFNLLGEDSIVLSKLLHALSVFIECMGSAAPPSALYRMVTLPCAPSSSVDRIVPR